MKGLCAALLCLSAGCELIIHFDLPPETGDQCGDQIDNDGNGVADCDDPSCAGSSYCPGSSHCGDGHLDPGEQCDDGNLVDADGCEKDCTLPRCGNGILDPPGALFAAQPAMSLGSVSPTAVAVADLDGDGQLDLLVADGAGDAVHVLSTPGDGTYHDVRSVVVGNGSGAMPVSIAAGDWSSDGLVDFVTADPGDSTLTFVRNSASQLNATGLTISFVPISVAMTDLQQDGFLDVIVGGQAGQLGVSHHPAVDFESPTPQTIGVGGIRVAAGDIDHDGYPDVVAIDGGAPTLSILVNDRTGQLQMPPVVFDTGTPSDAIVLADLDGDDRLDVIVASATDTKITVFLNRTPPGGVSAPSFTALPPVDVGMRPLALAVADFDGDGTPDVAVSSDAGSVLLLNHAAGGGMLSAPTTLPATATAMAATFADADDRWDLVALTLGTSQLEVLLDHATIEQCDHGPGGDATCSPACTILPPPDTAIWARQIGGAGLDQPVDITVDDDGNVYVTGTFDQSADLGNGAQTIPQLNDVYVTSYAPNGMFRWKDAFGGPTDDFPGAIAFDPDGRRVLVGGNGNGPIDFVGLGGTNDANQYFVVALRPPDGKPLKLVTSNDTGQLGTRSIQALAAGAGHIAVGGIGPDTSTPTPTGFIDLFDETFAPINTVQLSSPSVVSTVTRLAIDSTAHVYALGLFQGSQSLLGLTTRGQDDVFLAAFNPGGNFVWAQQIGGAGEEAPGDLSLDPWSDPVAVARFDQDLPLPTTTFHSAGQGDVAVLAYDPSGNLMWGTQVGTPLDESANAASVDSRGDVAIAGQVPTPTGPGGVLSVARTSGAPIGGFLTPYQIIRVARDAAGHLYAAAIFSGVIDVAGQTFTSRGMVDTLVVKLR